MINKSHTAAFDAVAPKALAEAVLPGIKAFVVSSVRNTLAHFIQKAKMNIFVA